MIEYFRSIIRSTREIFHEVQRWEKWKKSVPTFRKTEKTLEERPTLRKRWKKFQRWENVGKSKILRKRWKNVQRWEKVLGNLLNMSGEISVKPSSLFPKGEAEKSLAGIKGEAVRSAAILVYWATLICHCSHSIFNLSRCFVGEMGDVPFLYIEKSGLVWEK